MKGLKAGYIFALCTVVLLMLAACATPVAAPASTDAAGTVEAAATEAPAGEETTTEETTTEEATTEETTTEEATTEEATTEEAGTVGEVVTVGTNAEYQPFEFVDENGDIVGFDIDLMNAIGARAGFTPEFVNTKWDGIFVALASGEFDAVISAVTITEERLETVDFSESYFNAGQAIAVQADNDTITGPDSLVEGVTVGVQLGTTGDIWLTENTQSTVSRFDENPLAVQALNSGDVDAVVADAPTLADILRQNPELDLKLVGEPFTEELYGIAIQKELPELVTAIDAALEEMRADGSYDEIYNKWFGMEE